MSTDTGVQSYLQINCFNTIVLQSNLTKFILKPDNYWGRAIRNDIVKFKLKTMSLRQFFCTCKNDNIGNHPSSSNFSDTKDPTQSCETLPLNHCCGLGSVERLVILSSASVILTPDPVLVCLEIDLKWI